MKPILKISIFLLLPFFSKAQYPAFAQSKMAEQISNQCDSIYNLLTKETDANRKLKHIISFYAIGIDGYPLQLQRLSQKLFDLARQNNDLVIESSALSVVGQLYRLTGNYVKALESHRKAVAIAEQTGNRLLQGIAIQQMAHIYKDRLENEKALTLYKESNQKYEEADKNYIWWALVNIGYVYNTMGNYDSALYYLQEGLKRINSNNSAGPGSWSVSYSTIAGLYSKKDKPDSVAKYFELALIFSNKAQSPRYFNTTYAAIAEYFTGKRMYDSSAYYYKKAIDVVIGTEMSHLVLKPAKKLTDYYQNINADSTVKFWKVYSAANDSINSIRTNQQIQMITFEEDQRKRDIEAAQVAYQTKIRTGLLLGGLTVFSIIAFILYRNNRQKQKANIVLQEQKDKVESTLHELKSTQAQLIQSEKMASLGELTAGIAHEIQNPLNFVNNFSEVSKELIDEVKCERSKVKSERDEGLEGELLNDISQNLEKIHHHGKRADAIVKGMLAHSKSGTGKKELTNLNALTEEYLRLAFGGMLAKDKSFSATYKFEPDPNLPKIEVVPQDIGRVLLNLINNAFYVVNEQSKKAEPGYTPEVLVSTGIEGNRVKLVVKDNGVGIPDNIKDKIFQPFFTTKPTGEGTGLGLSLSYDIVKAHGGELKMETKEGEGSLFIILLPDL